MTTMEGVSEFASRVEEERGDGDGDVPRKELPGVGYGSLREEDGLAPRC